MNKDVRSSYNKISNFWNDFRRKTPINKCIIDFAKVLKPSSKILDIGCGTGYPIASYLSQQSFIVTGIDISEEMIKKAQNLNLPNATFLVEDILNFKSKEKYDAVIAFDSIWHIAHDNQKKIYPIISSLTAHGGLFLFTHGKTDSEIISTMWDEPFYHSALDLKTVHNLLIQNSFSILTSIENYQEETTGSRDLLIIAKKFK